MSLQSRLKVWEKYHSIEGRSLKKLDFTLKRAVNRPFFVGKLI